LQFTGGKSEETKRSESSRTKAPITLITFLTAYKKGEEEMRPSLRIVGTVAAITVLFTVRVSVNLARAQSSVLVELTGTVVSEDKTGGAYTLEFEGNERLFEIKDARMVGMTAHPGSASAWDILNEIGRRRILLLGSDRMAQPLMAKEASGRKFVLKGTLYVSNGTLVLESVRKAEGGAE
jgi:hypothetical protein